MAPVPSGAPPRIVDLGPEHEALFCVCLEDWSEEMKEAGDLKARWLDHHRDSGLRVKLALDDAGEVGGMIQYLPIEYAPALGHDLYFVLCIWVHGHGQGRGDFRHQGMGKALLKAAEADVRARGARGMAAWGLALPMWMRAGWYKRQGYRAADRDGLRTLVWKPFTEDALPPRWITRKTRPEKVPGQVTVQAFCTGWCPAQNLVHERARRAAESFGEPVVFQSIDTADRQTLLEHGISDAVFVDGKVLQRGPPPSSARIHRVIARRLRKL